VNATPLCALFDGAVVSASFVAAPAVPVAVKVTGLPDNVPDVAVSVFVPAVGLSVHEVRAAIPSDPVLTGVVGVTVPLPAAGVNVTATPSTGFPFASFTITDGGGLTAVPAGADVPPPFGAIVAAAPAVPVAVNVTGLPESDPDAAVSVFDPAVGLSVHEVRAAIPSDPVLTGVVGVTVPLPAAGLNVTATPVTGFPFASFTITDGGRLTAAPAGAYAPPLRAAIVAAAPAVPVAVNVTGLPVSPLAVAVSVLVPAVGLRVHDVSAAIPSAPVLTGVVGVTVPLPAAGVNVTATFATGFPFASFTITDGGGLTAVPAVADVPPAFRAIVAAAPAVPVAVKVTGLPESDPDVAVKVLSPAVTLRVQLPTVATPLALVVWLPPVIVPFPGATANVTATPVTGFPFASFTITEGGVLTAVPAVADWLVRLFAAIVAAAPALSVIVPDVGAVSVPLSKRSVQ